MVFLRVLSTLWKMLSSWRRVKFVGLSILLFIAGIFELIGMLALFGYIQGLYVKASGERSGRLALIMQRLQGDAPLSDYEYAISGGALLLAILIVKNLLSTLVRFLMNRFLMKLNHQVSSGLFEGYMRAPYERLKTSFYGNPAENVSEAFELFSSCFGATAQVLSDSMLLLMVVLLLLGVDPWLTLGCATTFLIMGTVLYRIMENMLIEIGRREVSARATSRACVRDGLRGIVEARLRNATGFFVSRYRSAIGRTTLQRRRKAAIARLPRSSNEMLLSIVIVGSVVYVTLSGSSVQEALPTLGLFGFAGLRLTNAMSRVNSSLQHLRQKAEQFDAAYARVLQVAPHVFQEATLEKDNDYLKDEQPLPDGVDGRLHHQLELKNVSFSYVEGDPPAVNDISLRIARGTFVSFCGSSGSGKSTLLMLIMGLMRPHKGQILCDGRDIFKSIRAWHRNIGYVGQQVFISPLSVRQNVAFGVPRGKIDDARVWRALEQAAAADFVRALPKGLSQLLHNDGARLSGGQRQRISIARALYHEPDILVFDEATAALDNVTEREITDAVARLAGTKTIICVAHRLSTIRDSDVIHMVEDGRIAASGTYDELIANSAEFRRMARPKPAVTDQPSEAEKEPSQENSL